MKKLANIKIILLIALSIMLCAIGIDTVLFSIATNNPIIGLIGASSSGGAIVLFLVEIYFLLKYK
jgi:hypothetical protein